MQYFKAGSEDYGWFWFVRAPSKAGTLRPIMKVIESDPDRFQVEGPRGLSSTYALTLARRTLKDSSPEEFAEAKAMPDAFVSPDKNVVTYETY
jgi:hypothetical protein